MKPTHAQNAIAVAAALLVTTFAAMAATEIPIANHSFEDDLDAWDSTGYVELFGPPRTQVNVGTDGAHSVSLGGFDVANSTLTTENAFGVIPGAELLLSFDFRAHTIGVAGLTANIDARILGATGATILTNQVLSKVSGSESYNGAAGFDQKTFTFTVPPNTPEIRVRFVDVSPNGGKSVDVFLDNIQLGYTEAQADVTLFPASGTFTNSTTVFIYSGVVDAEVKYTTDGSDPTYQSTLYTSPLLLTDDTTLKAQLFVDDEPASDVFSEVYTKYVPPDIEFVPGGGLFTNSVLVEFVNNVGPGVMRYTLDGSEPIATSTPYANVPLELTAATTVNARIFVNQFPVSDVYTANYTRVYAFEDDGVPFAWRETHFGPDFLTNPDAAADADPDGDLYTNLEEYESETNPQDSASSPEYIKLFVKAVPKLTFTTIPQSEYRILRATALEPTNWQAIVPSVVATDIILEFTDSNAPDNSFYQIELITE